MKNIIIVIAAVTLGLATGIDLTTPASELMPRQAPVLEPTKDCICVMLQQCNVNNFTLNKYGETIIDIRIKGPCKHYLEVCCRNDAPPSEPTSPSHPQPTPSHPPPHQLPQPGSQSPDPNPVTEQSTRPHTARPTTGDRYQTRGCGYRNEDGVGFRIIGGKNEAQFGEFPWIIAVLGENEKFICGGSLIHPKVVVTSTHCVRSKDIQKLVARAGEWDRGTTNEVLPHQDRKIDDVIEHEHYHSGGLLNDIALLILKEPFQLTDNVDVICLPAQDQNFDFSKCLASGWGKMKFNATHNNQMILKKVSLPVVPRHECEQILRTTRLGSYFTLHESFICAGGIKGQDTCNGDGGSPLMCPLKDDPERYEQAGIVAWGIGCGDVIPGIYASVSHFRDWINRHLGERGITISNTLGKVTCDNPTAACCETPPDLTQPHDETPPEHCSPDISNFPPTPSPTPNDPYVPNPQDPIHPKPQNPNRNPFPTPSHDIIVPQGGCGVRREASRSTVQRIVDVTGETFFAELPWMVVLLDGKNSQYIFKCGGSLIHPQIVLTAAHCVRGVDISSLIIRAGEWDSQSLNEPLRHQDLWAKKVISHPKFNPSNLWYDIAVILTDEPFKLDLHVDTICLPPKGFRFDGAKCIVSGWGKDKFGYGALDGTYRSILRKVEVPIVPNDNCQEQLRNTRLGNYFLLHESFVCAGGEADKDACQGDGGGPLVCALPQDQSRWAQVGIVAWGLGCGNMTNPAVYTNVPLLAEWIFDQIRILVPSESSVV